MFNLRFIYIRSPLFLFIPQNRMKTLILLSLVQAQFCHSMLYHSMQRLLHLTVWTLILYTLLPGWMQKQSGHCICGITEGRPSSYWYTAEFSPEVPESLTEAWLMGSCQVVRLLSVWVARGRTSLLQGDCMFSNRANSLFVLFWEKEAQCILKHIFVSDSLLL